MFVHTNFPYARTLSLPFPLMKSITVGKFLIIKSGLDVPGISSARNYGKLSVRV